MARQLGVLFGNRVLGPHEPSVSKIQNLYLMKILIKLEKKASPAKTKMMLQESIFALQAMPEYRAVLFQIDVDRNNFV